MITLLQSNFSTDQHQNNNSTNILFRRGGGGGEQLKLLPTAVTAATLTLTSQYCAHQASRRCHSHVPKLEDYIVRMGNKRSTTTQYSRKSEPFYFILEKKKKMQKNWFRNKAVTGV